MWEIYIDQEEFKAIKKDINFLNAIRLLRMINSIRSSQSLLVRIDNDDSEAGNRDRLEVILYYGAILYESIKTFYNMKSELKYLDDYKKCINDINYVINEFEDDKGFIKTILSKIRNKLMFHFDSSVFKKSIDSIIINKGQVLIARGDTNRNIDSNYLITTELIFNYLINLVDKEISGKEKLEYIYSKVADISKKFCRFVENIICGLLEEYAQLKDCT